MSFKGLQVPFFKHESQERKCKSPSFWLAPFGLWFWNDRIHSAHIDVFCGCSSNIQLHQSSSARHQNTVKNGCYVVLPIPTIAPQPITLHHTWTYFSQDAQAQLYGTQDMSENLSNHRPDNQTISNYAMPYFLTLTSPDKPSFSWLPHRCHHFPWRQVHDQLIAAVRSVPKPTWPRHPSSFPCKPGSRSTQDGYKWICRPSKGVGIGWTQLTPMILFTSGQLRIWGADKWSRIWHAWDLRACGVPQVATSWNLGKGKEGYQYQPAPACWKKGVEQERELVQLTGCMSHQERCCLLLANAQVLSTGQPLLVANTHSIATEATGPNHNLDSFVPNSVLLRLCSRINGFSHQRHRNFSRRGQLTFLPSKLSCSSFKLPETLCWLEPSLSERTRNQQHWRKH